MVDVLVNSNTAVFHQGVIVLKRSTIFQSYYQDGLISDLCGLISVFLYKLKPANFEYINFIQMIFYFKFYNFKRIYKRIEMRFRLGSKVSNVFNLINLLIIVLYICHLFACLWLFITR